MVPTIPHLLGHNEVVKSAERNGVVLGPDSGGHDARLGVELLDVVVHLLDQRQPGVDGADAPRVLAGPVGVAGYAGVLVVPVV